MRAAQVMKFRFEQQLALDRKSVFQYHETPAHLMLLMQGWPTFRMLDHDGTICCGSKIRVAGRVGPFWVPLTFEHFIYEPPYRFAERQIEGPFRRFEHIHEFVEDVGGTKIVDHVDVELPMWMGGGLATRLFVAPKLRRFFDFRKKSYSSLYEDGKMTVEES